VSISSAFYAQIFRTNLFPKPKRSWKKLPKQRSYKKFVRKTLMKLTKDERGKKEGERGKYNQISVRSFGLSPHINFSINVCSLDQSKPMISDWYSGHFTLHGKKSWENIV